MSLRGRLVGGLLLLAALGMVLLATVVYVEQRKLLYDRVDQQVQAALRPAPFILSNAASCGAGSVGAAAHDDGPPDGPRGPEGNVPAGTFAQLRTAAGSVVCSAPFVRYSSTATTALPRLPAKLTLGRPVTVSTAAGDYRVLAAATRDASAIVVAAVPLSDTQDTLRNLLLISALVIALVLAALAAGAWFLVGVGLRPLDRMGQTAGEIAAGDLSRRVDPATDRNEVGRLGLALNRMLERLEQAFAQRRASEDRLRRFLADASHELRTPLASIRGYAELFRIGAARDPEDTEKAMRRIEEEAARMGVLVEDLLTLARLDEVRETVREDVDLARLADDAVDDARATAPDREITRHGEGYARLSGDPAQLRQVLANLLRNALVHTPPGTPVEVSTRREGTEVVLEVRDHGPGLPTDDGDVLFERFWRAEEHRGRERGRAGAGLGLAIVAGIVHAHGGTVHADNHPGGGARFTVRLPLAAPPA